MLRDKIEELRDELLDIKFDAKLYSFNQKKVPLYVVTDSLFRKVMNEDRSKSYDEKRTYEYFTTAELANAYVKKEANLAGEEYKVDEATGLGYYRRYELDYCPRENNRKPANRTQHKP